MTQTPRHPSKILPWFFWGLGALFYFYEFLVQVSPSVMLQDLMRTFSVNATQIGNLAAFYFLAYAGMQIPVGMILDRFGARISLTLAILVCAIGCFIFGSAAFFHIAELGRFLVGMGSAFASIGTLYLAARWFPQNRFALLAGLTVTVGMLGATCGEAPISLMVQHFNWRITMMIFAIVGITLSIFIALIIRDRKITPQKTDQQNIAHESIFTILKKPHNWMVTIYGGLMFVPTVIFGGLWGVSFISAADHLPHAVAAFDVSFIFIGWAVGSPLFGWLSDYIYRRKIPMIIGSIGALITLSIIIYSPPLSSTVLILLSFLFGFFSSGFLLAYSIMRETHPPTSHGTAFGFTNFMNMVGTIIIPPIIGFILDHYWMGKMVAGARIYSETTYRYGLSALLILLFMALLLLPFIRETHCQSIYND